MGKAIYGDLIQTSLTVDARHLAIAVDMGKADPRRR
jgi:hypothetical protein